MAVKRFLIVLQFQALGFLAGAQTQPDSTANLATLCKVWGFIKYYHPVAASGKLDWDMAFIDHIGAITSSETKEDQSKIYLVWMDELGKLKSCRKCDKKSFPNALKTNFDNSWTDNEEHFTQPLIDELNRIENNRNLSQNFYVQQNKRIGNTIFDNEKSYPESSYPTAELRLLCLARYWNIINYYFPYKYLMDHDWNEVLEEMIPKFLGAADAREYFLAIRKLAAKINDSHAVAYSSNPEMNVNIYFVPFECKIIGEKLVITQLINDSLAGVDQIHVGDVIVKVNGQGISEIIDEHFKYTSASNDAIKLRNIARGILTGETNSVEVTIEKGEDIHTQTLQRYPQNALKYVLNNAPSEIIPGNIGYVNLGSLKRGDVDEIMTAFINTRAIIIDIRNGPNGDMNEIAKYLNCTANPFAKTSRPIMSYPGYFEFSESFSCGKKNKNCFKGKVVLLVNEQTQSHAEFTCMALQTANDVTCIGSQTAGADGNISIVPLPGGFVTYFTGIGIYYPDGGETQRIGIVPDIRLEPTSEGIKAGRDEVLEKAIEFILSAR